MMASMIILAKYMHCPLLAGLIDRFNTKLSKIYLLNRVSYSKQAYILNFGIISFPFVAFIIWFYFIGNGLVKKYNIKVQRKSKK